MLERSQSRIPVAGAIATLIFLSALAFGTRFMLRAITYADMDRELETLSQAIESDLEEQGLASLERNPLHRDVEANLLVFRLQRHSVIVYDRDRVVAVAGDVRQLPPAETAQLAGREDGFFAAVEPFSGQRWRARIHVAHMKGRAAGAALIIVRSMEGSRRTLDRIDVGLIAFVILGVAGSATILSFAVRSALRPVEEMTSVAETAEATDLSRRVRATSGGEELRRLAGVINSLFDRLERAFASQRRLVEDAAHELKTPAAIVLAESQEALRVDTTEP
ncbi:MAG TPA: HAMP domain-containing protein, partial [Thermoanaerobaculia bacterium]|nr:HAMP domain-containing protein [Thermoanaerobaculia bacterium]